MNPILDENLAGPGLAVTIPYLFRKFTNEENYMLLLLCCIFMSKLFSGSQHLAKPSLLCVNMALFDRTFVSVNVVMSIFNFKCEPTNYYDLK